MPSAPGSFCDDCHQRQFALHAEESATDEPQQRFVVTNILFAINIVIFLLMLWKHVPLMSPTSDQIVHWGGNFGPLTLGGQSWRLVSNVFLHIGLAHIFANMWALIVLGRLAESLYGRVSFLVAYLFAGIAGSLATLLWNPMTVSAGASGALFGISGALIATLYAGKLPLPKRVVRPVLFTLILWAAFDLGYGLLKPGVDNAAHIGGFIAGILIGFPLGHHLGPDRRSRDFRERILFAAALCLAALAFITWKREGYIVQVEHARQLISSNKTDEGLALLGPVAERKPKEPYLHLLMADAYLRKSDYPNAETEFKRLLALTPKNTGVIYNLATIYSQQKRWTDAAAMYTKAAELGNDNGLSWFNAGLMYRQADRPQDALIAFQKAVAKNQFFFEGWFNVGISLMNVKQPAQAVQALQKAVQLRPNESEAHLWLGNAMLASGQEEAAKTEFVKAFQLRAMQQQAIQQEQIRQRQLEQRSKQNNVQSHAPQAAQPK